MTNETRDRGILAAVQAGEPQTVVARKFGISRSRVGQILKEQGYDGSGAKANRLCAFCFDPIPNPLPGQKYCTTSHATRARSMVVYKNCSQCGKEVPRAARSKTGRIFCSSSHSALYYWADGTMRKRGLDKPVSV